MQHTPNPTEERGKGKYSRIVVLYAVLIGIQGKQAPGWKPSGKKLIYYL